jgi:hypothetical protein
MNDIPREPEADAPESGDLVEAVAADDGPHPAAASLADLEQRRTAGANWFFWVAGLSLVNSAILLRGGDTFFVIGLGITLIVDSMAQGIGNAEPELATTVKVAAFGFDLLAAAGLCLLGWLSRKGVLVVMALGMFLYLLDGLMFVLAQDWMSVAFHGFALWCMWQGFAAGRQFNALGVDLETPSPGPPAAVIQDIS